MRTTFTVALVCALVVVGILGYIVFTGDSRDTYQGRNGQARYCHDIGAEYVAATNSCRKAGSDR